MTQTEIEPPEALSAADAAALAASALQLTEECRLLALNAAIDAISVGEEGQEAAVLLAEMERIAAQVRSAVEAFTEAASRLGAGSGLPGAQWGTGLRL
ncbi:MAG: hypothetical protein AB1768_11875 [Pseudomonadota bacterium]